MLLLLFESEVKRGEFKHVWLACFMFAVVVVVGDRCCCITTKGVAAWRSLVAPRAPELGTWNSHEDTNANFPSRAENHLTYFRANSCLKLRLKRMNERGS